MVYVTISCRKCGKVYGKSMGYWPLMGPVVDLDLASLPRQCRACDAPAMGIHITGEAMADIREDTTGVSTDRDTLLAMLQEARDIMEEATTPRSRPGPDLARRLAAWRGILVTLPKN